MELMYLSKNIIEHWKAFIKFIFLPTHSLARKEWHYSSLYLFIITCIVLMVIGSVFQITFSGFFQTEKNIVQNKDIFILPNILILLIGGILAPIFEELSFRLPLRLSFTNIFIAVIASVITFTFISKSSILSIYNTQQINFSCYSLLIPAILLITFFTFKIISLFKNSTFMYSIFIWMLAILFALSHGYENIFSLQSFIYVLVSSTTQLLAGLYYSYLRLQFGIKLSIIIHCFWNTFLVLLKILFGNT